MTDSDIDEMGPVDYLVIEFPADRPPNGSALPLLLDLVERGIIRVLDLAFVRKDTDGSVTGIDISEVGLEGEVDVTLFAEASSGLLGDTDFDEAGAALRAGLLGGRARLREHLGCSAGAGTASQRRRTRRVRAYPGSEHPGFAGEARRRNVIPANEIQEEIDMPGLLRGVARTAVVAGTATAVSNRVSRRQGERWASQGQAVYGRPAQYAPEPEPVPTPPPAAPPPGGTDRIAALKDLAELKAQGVLTEAEFEREKARILAS